MGMVILISYVDIAARVFYAVQHSTGDFSFKVMVFVEKN